MIDTTAMRDTSRTGRQELIERIRQLCDELDQLRAKYADVLLLPGWFCSDCGVFNGEAKTRRFACRSCEAKNGGERDT